MKIETSSLERGSTKKGLAVQVIHMYKDYLWDMGDKSLPPDLNNEDVVKIDSTSKGDPDTTTVEESNHNIIAKNKDSKNTVDDVNDYSIDSESKTLSVSGIISINL